MKRFLSFALTAATLVAMLPMSAAGAASEFRSERVYFHCSGTTKVSNVNRQGLSEGMPSWDATAPAASVTTGAGCGVADPAFLGDTGGEDGGYGDGAWSGTFVGNIKDINVEAHIIYAGLNRADLCGGFPVVPRLYIDGVPLTETTEIDAIRTPSETGASDKVEFSFKGVDVIERNPDGTPVDGPGTKVHTVTLALMASYVDCAPIGAWVWDTTEVPSGLTFNPAQLHAARLNV